MDLLSADERAAVSTKIIKAIKYKGQVFHISALNGLGCKDLIAGMFELTKALNDE
jgi:GTP-binding protein